MLERECKNWRKRGNDFCDALCSHGGVLSCEQSVCKHQRKEKFGVMSCAELNQPWNY
jgi:hypothetical protein